MGLRNRFYVWRCYRCTHHPFCGGNVSDLSLLNSCVLVSEAWGCRMYDRTVKPIPEPTRTSWLRFRFETLVGITGIRMARYRISLWDAFCAPFQVVWRPHLLAALIFEVRLLSFPISRNEPHPSPIQFSGHAFWFWYWY